MKKISLIICLALFVAKVNAQTTFKVGDFYYQIVSVPNKTVKIVRGDGTYKGHLDIPSTIEYSGRIFKVISIKGAFSRNEDITSVHIPGTFDVVETEAFDRCTNLTQVIIDEGVKTIGESAFRKTAIPYIKLPSSVKTLEYHCFGGCDRLRKIDMPGVEAVNIGVFNGCKLLIDLTFPSTFKRLCGLGGLAGCSSLRTITFNSPVYWAGKLENCSGVVQIVSNTRTPKANAPFHYGTMDTKTTIVVPKGCLDLYTSTAGWNNFLNIKEMETTPVKMPTTAEDINKLGDEYYDGSENHLINYQKANECYRKAMEMGNANAYFNLAYNYEFGLGTDVKLKEAEKLYREALSKGFPYDKAYKHLQRIHKEVPDASTEPVTSRTINVVSFKPNAEGNKCKIKRVVCSGYEMTVYGVCVSNESFEIWWPKSLYVITKDGKKFNAVRATGIPLEPSKGVKNEGVNLDFSITFPKLPAGTTQFDMIESDADGSWKYFDITLKDPI